MMQFGTDLIPFSALSKSTSLLENSNTSPAAPPHRDAPTAPTLPPPNATMKSWDAHSTIKSSDLGKVPKGRRGLVLISSSLNNNIWVGKVGFPRGEHLHCASLVLGDQRLRVERIVRQ